LTLAEVDVGKLAFLLVVEGVDAQHVGGVHICRVREVPGEAVPKTRLG
jgi:hypothetical protein